MIRKYTLLVVLFALTALQVSGQPVVFSPRGIGGGGALFTPRINPANDDEFYVACDMSQMFRSTDYGNTYSQLHFNSLQAMNVSTYEFTSNPLIAYSNFNDGNAGYPVKTTDGGATWTMLPGFDDSLGQVYSMKANRNSTSQLLMDYYSRIVFSNDGGNTFTTVDTATNMGVGLIMGGVLFDGTNIYIGTNQGLYYSTTSGATFSKMTTTGIAAGQVIWQFAGANAFGARRFACITGLSTNVYNGLMPWDYSGLAAGVYIMDSANGTWVNKTAGINVVNDNIMYIGMAENDISTIYLGGHDGPLAAPLVMKSANGGNTWSKVFKTTTNANIVTGWQGSGGDKGWSWGETVFGVAVAPLSSAKVIISSFSDVHLSRDGANTWNQGYVQMYDDNFMAIATPTDKYYHSAGLENTTCWQIFWHSPNVMVSAFSDIGGIRSIDTGSSWGYTCNGMSVNSVYRVAKTPGGTMFAGTSNIHDMYQSTRLKDAQLDVADANGKIFYSADGGANWTLLHNFQHPVFWIAIDPNDSNTMYASVVNHAGIGAAGGIWKTSNLNSLAGSTWTALPIAPGTEGHPASIEVLNDGKVVCTYSGRISSGSTFTPSSGVYLFDPGTSSWADVSDPSMKYWTKDIVIDPSDVTQNTWYACVFTNWGLTGAGQGGLYRTNNRGTSWTKLTGTMFDRVTSITFDPTNSNRAYLTTETQGLWTSANMSASTPTWSQVSSYPFRQPERVYFNPFHTGEIWVTSFGNGMKIGSYTTLGATTFAQATDGLNVYPNPATDELHVILQTGGQAQPVLVYDMTGRLVARMMPGSSEPELIITTSAWKAGMYHVCQGAKSAKFIKK